MAASFRRRQLLASRQLFPMAPKAPFTQGGLSPLHKDLPASGGLLRGAAAFLPYHRSACTREGSYRSLGSGCSAGSPTQMSPKGTTSCGVPTTCATRPTMPSSG